MADRTLSISIGERVVPIAWDMRAWLELDEIHPGFDIDGYIKSLKDKGGVKRFVTLLRIACNCGLRRSGEQPDMTDDFILDHFEMQLHVVTLNLLCWMITYSMFMQQVAAGKTEETDEILEEIKKKGPPAD